MGFMGTNLTSSFREFKMIILNQSWECCYFLIYIIYEQLGSQLWPGIAGRSSIKQKSPYEKEGEKEEGREGESERERSSSYVLHMWPCWRWYLSCSTAASVAHLTDLLPLQGELYRSCINILCVRKMLHKSQKFKLTIERIEL